VDLKDIRLDSAKIDGGDWVGDIAGFPKLRLRVRGLNSLSYQSALARLARAVPRAQRDTDGALKSDGAWLLQGEALAESVLLDWSGVTEGGEPVPFSKDKARELLCNRDFLTFREAVLFAAAKVGECEREAQDDILGKSETSSAGN
jgi:hypothetical protein